MRALVTDARDDLARETRRPTRARRAPAFCSRLLPSFGQEALELVDRDEPATRACLDRLDIGQDAPVECGGADAERLGRLRPRIGEPLDEGRLEDDYRSLGGADCRRRVATFFLASAPSAA